MNTEEREGDSTPSSNSPQNTNSSGGTAPATSSTLLSTAVSNMNKPPSTNASKSGWSAGASLTRSSHYQIQKDDDDDFETTVKLREPMLDELSF